jgi:hypothetical protein
MNDKSDRLADFHNITNISYCMCIGLTTLGRLRKYK